MRAGRVFGRVWAPTGEPISDADVRLDIPNGRDAVGKVRTDVRGNFSIEYTLDQSHHGDLIVKVTAAKPGYSTAWEAVNLAVGNRTGEVALVMRMENGSQDEIPFEELTHRLIPRLVARVAPNLSTGPVQADFQRGVAELLKGDSSNDPGELLGKVTDQEPCCIDCRILQGLALLEAGNWQEARRQIADANKLNEAPRVGPRLPEPAFVLGVLEEWRRDAAAASGFFQQALGAAPNDPLVLQELGRMFAWKKDWKSADQYLDRAIRAGAPDSAWLLGLRVLLQLNNLEKARVEMARYLNGRGIQQFPVDVRLVYLELARRLALRRYATSDTVVNRPVESLVKEMPELKGLQPATSQESLDSILERVGQGVLAFFNTLPNTISREMIRQETFDRKGNLKKSSNREDDYLLLSHEEEWGLGVKEYRADSGREPEVESSAGRGLNSIRTLGFTCASLIFHPNYQPASQFRYLGQQMVGGQRTLVLAFAQKPESGVTLEQFIAKNKSYPVLLQGIAWINPRDSRILRMETDLLRPPPGSGLDRRTTEINFAKVHFKDSPSVLWLPRDVSVAVQWNGNDFRNTHHYSNYRIFKVETLQMSRPMSALASSDGGPGERKQINSPGSDSPD
jgi:tetratricopeptide (TPR) repeat protein